jgi:hypothetical protein
MVMTKRKGKECGTWLWTSFVLKQAVTPSWWLQMYIRESKINVKNMKKQNNEDFERYTKGNPNKCVFMYSFPYLCICLLIGPTLWCLCINKIKWTNCTIDTFNNKLSHILTTTVIPIVICSYYLFPMCFPLWFIIMYFLLCSLCCHCNGP